MAAGIGLSVGATALRAVAVGRSAVTRSPVLTRYPDRPSEVGVPSENPNLVGRGLIITDFVDRVGDPVAIVANDGSSHRAENVLAEALRALSSALTGGRPPVEPVGATHPAHWRPSAVEALRGALGGIPLTSDAVAALTALQDDPGVPSRGVIALCDVGGTGVSITLADAGNGFQPIAPTVRHLDFSGDLVDQELLTRIVGDLASSGSVDVSSTSAIGNLSRLRAQCRTAKERLSTSAVTSVTVDLPDRRTEVRVTRPELDEAIRGPLAGLLDVMQEALQRNGIRSADLVAVATVGGGALIPIVVTSLSEHLRVPVVTSARPELVAAIGGGLTAVRRLVPDGATSMAPAAVPPLVAPPPTDGGAPASSTFRALAWSDADDVPEPVPPAADHPEADDPAADYDDADYDDARPDPYDPRPQIAFADPEADARAVEAAVPWYRRPAGLVAVGALAVLATAGAVGFYVLRNDESSTPATTPTAKLSSTVPSAPPPTEVPPTTGDAAPPVTEAPDRTVYEQAPQPPAVTVTEAPPPPEPPPSSTEASAPPPATTATTATTAPSTVTVTESPPSSTSQQPLIPTLPYQTIPGLPFVPAPVQPPSP